MNKCGVEAGAASGVSLLGVRIGAAGSARFVGMQDEIRTQLIVQCGLGGLDGERLYIG